MNAETKKFLKERKIGAFLPWIGIVGMLVLTFSPIMGGFTLFFTELGYVAIFYFFIDEYNWLIQRLLINRDHTINHSNEKKVKPILFIFIILTLIAITTISFLRQQSFYNFVVGVSFLYGIYFSHHNIEYLLIILQTQFSNFIYYSVLFLYTFIMMLLLLFLFCINAFYALYLLILLSIIYVLERDILKEMKKRGKKIDWEDDDDRDRFNCR